MRNLEPEQLRDALLDDVGALGQILKAAVANHRLSGNERAPQELPLSEVERIVKSDFSNAAQFMIVSSRKLDKFLSTYGNGEILHQSRERANRLIRNAKLRRHAVRKIKTIFETPAGSGR